MYLVLEKEKHGQPENIHLICEVVCKIKWLRTDWTVVEYFLLLEFIIN